MVDLLYFATRPFSVALVLFVVLILFLCFLRLRQIDRSLRSIAQSLDVLSGQRAPFSAGAVERKPLQTSSAPAPMASSMFGR